MTLMTERFQAAGAQVSGTQASLPAPTTPIVGREREIGELSKLLAPGGARLVTLTGPGGVGKTRLALETASSCREHFAGEVFFVPLAAVEDPAHVSAAVARALGLNPVREKREADAIGAFFGDRRALLVLDNFEQVAEAAPFVSELLSKCPVLVALVTSRAVLRLQGEHEFTVEPLGVPAEGAADSLTRYDSVRLFSERARAARPDFRVDDRNAPAVAQICHRLDGLPLAIELAAARIKLLPPERLLERLDAGLELVSGGRRDAPERHQALRNTVRWSYELLRPEEKELFARLGVFAGRFTLEAAEAVCATADAADVVESLSSLIDNSLVRGDPGGRTPGFQMLRTIRQFAVEVLEASDLAVDARRQHARYYFERARAAGAGIRGPDLAAWSAELEPEEDNLRPFTWPSAGAQSFVNELADDYENVRAALDWAAASNPCSAIRLLAGTQDLFQMFGPADGLRLARLLLERCPARDRHRVEAQIIAGALAFMLGDFQTARSLLADARELSVELDEPVLEGWAHFFLGLADTLGGAIEPAREHLEAARALHDRPDAAGLWARATSALGLTFLIADDPARARELVEQALAVDVAENNEWGKGQSHLYLGIIAESTTSDPQAVTSHYHEAVDRLRLFGGPPLPAALIGQAGVLAPREPAKALRVVAAAYALRDRAGAEFQPFFRARAERIRAAAEAPLGPEAEAVWAEGKRLGVDEAIVLAFGPGDSVPAPDG